MNDDLIITDASAADAPAIAVLEKQYIPEAWSVKLIEEETGKENAVFLTSWADGVLCGYISGENIAGEFYVNNIAVDGNYRRRHIAYRLMQELCRRAEAMSCEFITLEVRSANTAASALYEKCGFSLAGRRKNYYSSPADDALIYTKYFR